MERGTRREGECGSNGLLFSFRTGFYSLALVYSCSYSEPAARHVLLFRECTGSPRNIPPGATSFASPVSVSKQRKRVEFLPRILIPRKCSGFILSIHLNSRYPVLVCGNHHGHFPLPCHYHCFSRDLQGNHVQGPMIMRAENRGSAATW